MSRIYLGRLSNRAQEKDIERFFKGYGKIMEIMLKNGFAFLDFESSRDARDAAFDLNGRVLCGERVIVEIARGTPHGEDYRRDIARGYQIPQSSSSRDSGYRGGGGGGPPVRTNYRVIIKNLSSGISWQDLKDVMRKAGEVMYTDAHRDRKNEGIVEFSSYREVLKAIEKFDGTDLNGRKIEVIDDTDSQHQDDRDSRRRRSRSRSGDRGSRHRRRGRSGDSRSRSHSHDRRRKARHSSEESDTREKKRKRTRSRSPRKSKEEGRAKSEDGGAGDNNGRNNGGDHGESDRGED